MVKNSPDNNHRYKGFYYGTNKKGDFVVLPINVSNINSPSAFPLVPAVWDIDLGEKEKRAREYIDFLTTVEEGVYYIAENVSDRNWWVSIVKGVFFIADATGKKSHLRPKNHEWKRATTTQIDLLKSVPLIRVV